MVLFLAALDKEAQLREFSCQLDKLEVAFDFLSTIVARGDTLLSAYILDNEGRTDLPIDVFDGDPFLEAMQEMEKDWQSILSEPLQSDPSQNQYIIQFIQQRVRQYETRMTNEKLMIGRLEQLLLRSEENISSGQIRSRLIRDYEAMINRYQVQLIKTKLCHKIAVERLNQLIA